MKKLERTLSLPSVIAIAIGGMLGSGIFVLPGIAAAKTGPSIWMAYLLAGICVLPAALSKAELSTAMPTSGGTYVYIEKTFGPLLGTIAGFGLWLSLLLKSSFALVGFSAYLLVLANMPLKPMALAILLVIMVINIMGVKKVGTAQIFVVSLSLTGMLILVFFGLFEVDAAMMQPAFTHGGEGLLAAAGFVFVSYAGVTKIAAIAEEVKNPNRNLPLGMLLALGLIAGIYGFVVFTMAGNLPIETLSTDLKPIFSLANKLGGYWGGIIAAVLGVVTLGSMANSGVLAASRFPFAMSRDNLLPPFLKRVHHRFLTPVACIILTCGLMAVVIIFLDVEKIAKLASAFMVMMFVMVNLAVIVLRETGVQWYRPGYYSPLYPWIQLFGVISGVILLVIMGGVAIIGAIGIVIIGAVVYFSYGKSRANRRGVLHLYGRRATLTMLFKLGRNKTLPPKPTLSEQEIADLDKKDPAVVVPIYGNEQSPEMLVEIGSALSGDRTLEVVHLTEVPDQTALVALEEEGVAANSLKRRLGAMSKEKSIDLDFETVATHELVETIHAISERAHCDWLVMGWDGRTSEGLLVKNPIGWLVNHLSCHLALFKDNGVRYIREIMVFIEPGANELLVANTASQLALSYSAHLTFMRIVPKDATQAEVDKQAIALKSLLKTFPLYATQTIIKHNDPVDAIIEASAGFDLVVTGAHHTEGLLGLILGIGKDKLTREAACSVLMIHSPEEE